MRRLWILPLLALAIGCADSTLVEPELAGSPDVLAAEKADGKGDVVKMVPLNIKGTWWQAFEGDPSICDDVSGTDYIQYIEWEGNASHMGKVTGANVNCLGPGPQGGRPLLAQGGEFIAANGDVLRVFGERATLTVDLTDFSFEIGPVDFAGGTGRFENATGWYQLYGEDALTGGAFTLVGEISSVGSSK